MHTSISNIFRLTVLYSAESELCEELLQILLGCQDVASRSFTVFLDKTLCIFRYTYGVYMKVSSPQAIDHRRYAPLLHLRPLAHPRWSQRHSHRLSGSPNLAIQLQTAA